DLVKILKLVLFLRSGIREPMSRSESRHLYSWWWNSHITPKNSKWLLENISDMDVKVKSMIKLIEEDADSFARRAEMYYEKRPELMKLVEEFYRAYRALAERYYHATGELRHAHKTLAKAFPNQVTLKLDENSSLKSVVNTDFKEHLESVLFNTDHSLQNIGRFSHKFSAEAGSVEAGSAMFPEISPTSSMDMEEQANLFDDFSFAGMQNQNILLQSPSETDKAGGGEIDSLRKSLEEMQVEKDDMLLQYQQCVEKLSRIEQELDNAMENSRRLDEEAIRYDIEVQTLRVAFLQLETEVNIGREEYLKKISHLEGMTRCFEEDKNRLGNRTIEAESQLQILQNERSRLELEKEAVVCQYQECLGKVSDLQHKISVAEDEARFFKNKAERAQIQITELRKAYADLSKEKDTFSAQYYCCTDKVSQLENDLCITKDDVRRLTSEVLVGTTKLRTAEEKCTQLEMSNKSLRVEADNLAKKIAIKDQEVSRKEEELEELQTCMKDERAQLAKVEAALQSAQDLHSKSTNDQMAIALELKNMLQVLEDKDVSKIWMEETHQVNGRDGLNLSDLSSAVPVEKKHNGIQSLMEIKEKIEKEVLHHIEISISLQNEISFLKKQTEALNSSYQSLVEELEAAGLNPNCVETSIKNLQEENSRLNQICEQERKEKGTLSKKVQELEVVLQKNATAENSLIDLDSELHSTREKMKALQESFRLLHGEKSTLVADKASLLSQLQGVTDTIHNLLERNALLENSLSSVKVELEGLRGKSKGLEEICELLKDEKSQLLAERANLIFKLEDKYSDLEKENESMQCQVETLQVSLSLEKQQRKSFRITSETRLVGLENEIHLLQEENKLKKKEYQEGLDKALKVQYEMSTLQKFMKDMEEKNGALIIECQKHVEASKLAEKLISELENENLRQQMETEILFDEIERLRFSMFQIIRSLEIGAGFASENNFDKEKIFVSKILRAIEDMKSSMCKHEDEKHNFLVEKTIFLALLEQFQSKGKEAQSINIRLEEEFEHMAERFSSLEKEKKELLKMNERLKLELCESRQDTTTLEAELGHLFVKIADLQKACDTSQDAYRQVNVETDELVKKFSDLQEEKCLGIQEFSETANTSAVCRGFWIQRINVMKLLLDDLSRRHEANSGILKEMKVLAEEQEDLLKAENVSLRNALYSLETEVQAAKECNSQMNSALQNGEKILIEMEAKLFDTEMKLQAAESSNAALCRSMDELKNDIQHDQQVQEHLRRNMLRLSEKNSLQEKEIASLNNLLRSSEIEIGALRHEIEENIIREQTLNMELEDMSSEFDLWETEASSSFLDFQVASIQEVVLKHKVQELTDACQTLENDCAVKASDIEQMKGTILFMVNEISGLKSQLNAYEPILAALKNEISLLETYTLPPKVEAENGHQKEVLEVGVDTSQTRPGNRTLVSLQDLQMKVRQMRKLMEEGGSVPTPRRRSNFRSRQDGEHRQIKSRNSFSKHEHGRKKVYLNGHYGSPKLHKVRSKVSEVRIGMLMKDIPLDEVSGIQSRGLGDQMLGPWEASPMIGGCESSGFSYRSTEMYENVVTSFDPLPTSESEMDGELCGDQLKRLTMNVEPDNRELDIMMDDRKILEGLYSDALKLELLQTRMQNLRRKVSISKNRKEFETVERQLQEAEATIVHLVDLNSQLVKNIEDCPPDEMVTPRLKEAVKTWRMKVVEQSRKGSAGIHRLQFQVQRIQHLFMELEDAKKEKQQRGGGSKFFRGGRSVVLKEFVYSGGRKMSTRRAEKEKDHPPFYCFRQPNSN
ncbi:hypothetical protein M569_01665, partial [Genlisea aurea]